MRKVTFLVAVIAPMAMALAADATLAGPAEGIEVQGSSATFSGTLQEPAITTSPILLSNLVIIGERSGSAFGASLKEPEIDTQH